MEIIWDIGLQTIEILTLIFGILGMTISVLLLFSPNLAKGLSNILNRNVDVDKKLEYLDKEIEITEYFYKHNTVMGALLIAGSVFCLFFFFFLLDINKFTGILFGYQKHIFVAEVVMKSVVWVGKIGCLVSLICGFLLVFAPDTMRRLENKLNSLFETKSVLEKLDRSTHDLDAFFFRHTTVVGLIGTVISLFLISLSIINLLK